MKCHRAYFQFLCPGQYKIHITKAKRIKLMHTKCPKLIYIFCDSHIPMQTFAGFLSNRSKRCQFHKVSNALTQNVK